MATPKTITIDASNAAGGVNLDTYFDDLLRGTARWARRAITAVQRTRRLMDIRTGHKSASATRTRQMRPPPSRFLSRARISPTTSLTMVRTYGHGISGTIESVTFGTRETRSACRAGRADRRHGGVDDLGMGHHCGARAGNVPVESGLQPLQRPALNPIGSKDALIDEPSRDARTPTRRTSSASDFADGTLTTRSLVVRRRHDRRRRRATTVSCYPASARTTTSSRITTAASRSPICAARLRRVSTRSATSRTSSSRTAGHCGREARRRRRARITIDASGANGMDFEAFIRGGFLSDITVERLSRQLRQQVDNHPDHSPARRCSSITAPRKPRSTCSPMVEPVLQLWRTHVVGGTIDTIEYGTRGSGPSTHTDTSSVADAAQDHRRSSCEQHDARASSSSSRPRTCTARTTSGRPRGLCRRSRRRRPELSSDRPGPTCSEAGSSTTTSPGTAATTSSVPAKATTPSTAAPTPTQVVFAGNKGDYTIAQAGGIYRTVGKVGNGGRRR